MVVTLRPRCGRAVKSLDEIDVCRKDIWPSFLLPFKASARDAGPDLVLVFFSPGASLFVNRKIGVRLFRKSIELRSFHEALSYRGSDPFSFSP